MFTVGIFSTHIPYIVFVFFYALFFLFSGQRTFTHEIEKEERIISCHLMTDTGSPEAGFEKAARESGFNFPAFSERNELFLTVQKKLLPFPLSEQLETASHSFSYFSRPPPSA